MENKYIVNIIELMKHQEKKGLATYGKLLQDNTDMTTVERIEYLEEELVDALMYLEHLKADVTDTNVGNNWIPFRVREADEEEKEMYGTSHMLDGKLPDDGEEILVTYSGGAVSVDVFVRDGYECYLESGVGFVDTAIAWQPMPEPYKGA